MDQDEELRQGLNAMVGARFEEAARILLPLAESGEVEAQKMVARLYFAGNGVEKNLEQYEYWLEKAAYQGDRQSKAKLKRLQRKNT